jgi:hypothetical protein
VTSAGIQIRPMNLPAANTAAIASKLVVTLTGGDGPVNLTTWAPQAQSSDLPASLWGAPLHGADPPAAADVVTSTTGVRLTAPRAKLGPSPGLIDMATLTDELPAGPQVLDATTQQGAVPAPTVVAGSVSHVAQAFGAANADATQKAQQAILDVLAQCFATPPTTAPTAGFATQAGQLFAEAPMEVAA